MRSIRLLISSAALAALLATGCGDGHVKYPTTDSALKLDRVVLYRNGVGYFERIGDVDGDMLRIRVRKDQVNDLLKSLTVVERKGGKAVSVSMPLDPQSWANAALATLQPGRGNLAEVLDALRGTSVSLSTSDGSMSGRIVMVEEVVGEPSDNNGELGAPPLPMAPTRDHRVTLLDGDQMRVVLLSKIHGVTLEDGDLAMQFNRTLDASAGEGMFQQVEVDIRLTGSASHDLLVSYVVSAPIWKPTYRVVLPKDGKGKALLQGWAVVDNTSGEDWGNVSLGLTSGAPIAFRYDLHTPREVNRADLTESGVERQAQAMIGETSYSDKDGVPDEAPPPPPMAQPAPAAATPSMPMGRALEQGDMGGGYGVASNAPAKARGKHEGKKEKNWEEDEPRQQIDFDSLKRSTLAEAKSQAVSGLTRFDLDSRVTVPQGTSTMVALINADVEGEETFLYRPGTGAGPGFETNPYRVVRFRNATPFVLEPGPISIYSGGSFVGEGLSEAVGTNTSATIPFAVESGIMVTSTSKSDADELRLVKMSRGVLEVESFGRRTTTYQVKSQTKVDGFSVLIRHPKAGWNYELAKRPDGTEDLPDAYLVKVDVAQGKRDASLEVVEQTPESARKSASGINRRCRFSEKLIVASGAHARHPREAPADHRSSTRHRKDRREARRSPAPARRLGPTHERHAREPQVDEDLERCRQAPGRSHEAARRILEPSERPRKADGGARERAPREAHCARRQAPRPRDHRARLHEGHGAARARSGSVPFARAGTSAFARRRCPRGWTEAGPRAEARATAAAALKSDEKRALGEGARFASLRSALSTMGTRFASFRRQRGSGRSIGCSRDQHIERARAADFACAHDEPSRVAERVPRVAVKVRCSKRRTEEGERAGTPIVERASFAKKQTRPSIVALASRTPRCGDERLHGVGLDDRRFTASHGLTSPLHTLPKPRRPCIGQLPRSS